MIDELRSWIRSCQKVLQASADIEKALVSQVQQLARDMDRKERELADIKTRLNALEFKLARLPY